MISKPAVSSPETVQQSQKVQPDQKGETVKESGRSWLRIWWRRKNAHTKTSPAPLENMLKLDLTTSFCRRPSYQKEGAHSKLKIFLHYLNLVKVHLKLPVRNSSYTTEESTLFKYLKAVQDKKKSH